MFSVEIRSHSYGTGAMPWVDHLGNPIEKFVFSKKYYSQYSPGHYPLESLGSLYRNIDDFRQSPLQSLADWQIRIPSIYSSKDGAFQTVDLFYFLECVNEDFELIGCEAVLLDDGQLVFSGVVDSVASGTGGATISIGEGIGSPEIKKSDFPLVMGAASMQYWPVKFEKNEMGRNVVVISEKPLERFYGLFVYLEKRKEFARVSFSTVGQNIEYSEGWQTAILTEPDNEVWTLEHDVEAGAPFKLSSGAMSYLRPEPEKETPDNYVVGDAGNFEFVQAWSSRRSKGDFYTLGREAPEKQRYHYAGEKIKKTSDLKTNEFCISMNDIPESLVINEPRANTDEYPRTDGNFSAFLKTSERMDGSRPAPIDVDLHPRFFFSKRMAEQAVFIVNFPEMDLPGSAYLYSLHVSVRFCFEGRYSVPAYKSGYSWLNLQNLSVRLEVGEFSETIKSVSLSKASDGIAFSLRGKNLSVSATRRIKLRFFSSANQTTLLDGSVTLGGCKMHMEAKVPFDGSKLYASGMVAGSADLGSGKSIIPSINSLLGAALAVDYSVRAIGELNDVEYGSIVNNEAVLLRDKLRELASESATLVKFAPGGKEFLVKSVSTQFDYYADLIPLAALVLENNMYCFEMESPNRNDILDGILVSWGKDAESGKYEHSLSVDLRGVFRDGEMWDMQGSMLGGKWRPVIAQLQKKGETRTTKSIDSKWVMDWAGAELMAYNHLCWNCAPLRKAQVKCITPVLRDLQRLVDIGDFIHLDLPGYPLKLATTAWVITGRHDDLDKMITTLELLEAWNMPVISPDRFLLLENGGNILTEAGQNIKLENLYE